MCRVKNLLVKDFLAFKREDTVNKVLKALNHSSINGAPIIDDDNKLLGMIVKADIYRFLIEEGHYDTCPIDWVMTKNVVVGYRTEKLIDIAIRIRHKDIIAIPIVDEQNKVKGIITVEDILDYFIKNTKK